MAMTRELEVDVYVSYTGEKKENEATMRARARSIRSGQERERERSLTWKNGLDDE